MYMLVYSSVATLLIQLRTKLSGKAAEDGPNVWAPVTQMAFWVPGFTAAVWEGTNRWKISLYLSFLSTLTFKYVNKTNAKLANKNYNNFCHNKSTITFTK